MLSIGSWTTGGTMLIILLGDGIVLETTTFDSVTWGVFYMVLSNVVSAGKGVILGVMEGCDCGGIIILDSGTVGLGASTVGCGMVLMSFRISLLLLTRFRSSLLVLISCSSGV